MAQYALDELLEGNRREYARHGVTCLRGLFDRAQVAALAEANASDTTRTGYALRVVGDDVTWCLTKSRWLQIPGVDYPSVTDGAPITDDAAFPVMWRDLEGRATAA